QVGLRRKTNRKMTGILLKTVPVVCEPSNSRSGLLLYEAFNSFDLATAYNHHLENVLMKSIAVERDFKNKVSLRSKMSGLLALQEEVYGFSVLLDKLIDLRTSDTLECLVKQKLPSLISLKELKVKICFLKKHFRLNELPSIFGDFNSGSIPSDGHILATILGLNPELGDLIDNSVSPRRKDQDYFYDLVKILETKDQNTEYDPEVKGTTGMCKSLTLLGFTKERSEAIAKNISEDIVDLQTPLYWAVSYLENELMYHPLLSEIAKFPYSEQKTDEWFKENISSQRAGASNSNASANINVFNCTGKNEESPKLIQDFLKKVKEEDGESKLFYHGTTHLNAQSIINSGITLTKGKQGNDFSSGDGFYLFEEFQYAEEWVRDKMTYYAVLVFKVKQDFVNPVLKKGLDVSKDQSTWQEIINYCQSCYKDKSTKRILKGVTFIRGPTSAWGAKKGRSGFGRGKIQFCIRDEQYSDEFGRLENICCAIFYSK
ncbi:hypothetical protein BgiMline_014732, partial [Biomphalaria glabrata]